MGNQQSYGCFTPRKPKSRYHSEIIQKKRKRISREQKNPENHLEIPIKIMGQSYPISSSVENNDGIITIKIQINIKGSQEQNEENQDLFNGNQIKIQINKPQKQNYAVSAEYKTDNILRQSQETMSQENAPNILEIDLPETTTRRGSFQMEMLSQ